MNRTTLISTAALGLLVSVAMTSAASDRGRVVFGADFEGADWSVEHGLDRNDRSRGTTPTKRERLLRSWFEKNRKLVSAAK